MIRKYQNLKVWEKATELALQVYGVTKAFPRDEVYGLTSQVRRAVVSIPSNIAEGSERKSASAENGKMLNGLISKLEGSSSGDWRLAIGD